MASNDPIEINVFSEIKPKGSLMLEHRGPDGTTRGLRTADGTQSAGADHSAESPPAFTLAGQNRHEREGEVEVCSVLLEHLAAKGLAYSGLRQIEDKDYPGVDCIAEGPTGTLKMQVTRAVRGDFRAKLANAPERQVSHSYATADEAADAIREAVEDKFKTLAVKRHLPIGEIALVLDSRETLAHVVSPDVVASFGRRHGAWAQGLGFQAVWLVGPGAHHVFQFA